MAEFKQWREEKRTALKDVVPLDSPYNILIEASSLCNAKCIYCSHSQHPKSVYYGNMTMELYEHVLHDIGEFPSHIKLFEMFAFGEPLCNPNLPEMISMAKASGLVDKVAFTTNGILFTEEKIDKLIASGVDIIRISLQGLNEKRYRQICGVNLNFSQFIETLSYLYRNKKQCSIRMKIADVAIKDEEYGKKKFEEIFGGIADSIFIEHILPMYADVNYDNIDEKIKQTTINGRENVVQTEVHKVCHRPFYRLRIGANGDVTAACCDTPHDIKFGNIKEHRLVDLWNGGGRLSFLKMQLEGRRFQHPVCKRCVLANDITNELDILDPWADEILQRMS